MLSPSLLKMVDSKTYLFADNSSDWPTSEIDAVTSRYATDSGRHKVRDTFSEADSLHLSHSRIRSKAASPAAPDTDPRSIIAGELGKLAARFWEKLDPVLLSAKTKARQHRARESARRLTQYGDNWDGEGAAAITSETVGRAIRVLDSLVEQAEANFVVLPMPDFGPSDSGSVDLQWETGRVTLLLNVPSDESEEVGFFGMQTDLDSAGPGKVGGEFYVGASRPDIVAWLTQ